MSGRARALAAASALALGAGAAHAQDPVRLPGVNVTARIEKPGPRILTGIVVDTLGNPIAGAEVSLPRLRKRLYSRDDGTFRFDSVPRGDYSLRARKIGFAPQVREFTVDSGGGIAQFALMPLVQGLPSMLTTATRRGLSGSVTDMDNRPVPGAFVRLLGQTLTTRTDSAGNFFMPAEPGRYMVSIAKDAYTTNLTGVLIPKDSGRHLNAWLMVSSGPVTKQKYWNIPDLADRQAWVKPQNKVLYTRDDLIRMKIDWVVDAMHTAFSRFPRKEPYSPDCRVVVNGGPEIADISMLTIDDIEIIEIYNSFPRLASTAAASSGRGGVAVVGGRGAFLSLSNTRDAAFENRTRSCPAVYVWTR